MIKKKDEDGFLIWGARAILTTIVFPGLLMGIGWFLSFVTTATKTQAELKGMKELNESRYESISTTLQDIKKEQEFQRQDITDIKNFLLPKR